jgi:hypothetical protein
MAYEITGLFIWLMTFALVFKLVHVLVLIVNKYICIILSLNLICHFLLND